MDLLRRLVREAHRRSLWHVLGLYLVASWGALEAVAGLAESAGLPDWVPPAALVLLILGLPVVLATAVVQEGAPGAGTKGRRASEAGGPAPSAGPGNLAAGTGSLDLPATRPSFLERHLTWKRVAVAGGLGVALIGVAVAGYFVLWSAGIGPVGSLEAQGVFEEGEAVVLADFADRSGDAALGPVVTEALRIDLVESPSLEPVPRDEVGEILERMEAGTGVALDTDAAREVALRGGYKAVIDGEVAAAGSGYLLTASIRDAASGRPLAAFRETAGDEEEVIGAIDQLSQRIREKAGESLRSIKSGPELEDVTTGSLEALRLFGRAEDAFSRGEDEESLALLRDAVELDPDFAMAWRKLAVVHANTGLDPAARREATVRAWELRERLSPVERHLAEAQYHKDITRDRKAVIRAYESLLRIEPDHPTALNNLANEYGADHELPRAEELYRRAVTGPAESNTAWSNLVRALIRQRRFDDAAEALAGYRESYPEDDMAGVLGARLVMVRGDPDAAAVARGALEADALGPLHRIALVDVVAREAHRRGRIGEARDHYRRAVELAEPLSPALAYNRRLWWALAEVTLGEPGRVPRILGEDRDPPLVERLPPASRFPFPTGWLLAETGRADRSAAILEEWRSRLEPEIPASTRRAMRLLEAQIASVRGEHDRAVELVDAMMRDARNPRRNTFERARILERSGRTREAIALWEEARSRVPGNLVVVPIWRVVAPERLGPLHEAVGDTAEAVAAYRDFADAWADADPELRPRVRRARERAEALEGATR